LAVLRIDSKFESELAFTIDIIHIL
jgi:hypothetical protein